MSSSGAKELIRPLARGVSFTETHLVVDLTDGRTVSVPLEWYPRLANSTVEERSHWELIGEGDGIHWPSLDEDLSVDGFLEGRRSGETLSSFGRWLGQRKPLGN